MKTLKNIAYIVIISSLIVFSSCTPEEKIINPAQDTWTLLTISKGNPNVLQQSQIINNIPANTATVYNRGIEITGIKEYRNMLFLMMPSIYKIMILDRATYKAIDSIDFSISKRIPSDIAFGNATSAYIAHQNDSIVTVYDLFNFKIATEIKVGNGGIAIQEGLGNRQNQIFVANSKSNSVSQIDTRTNTVIKTYNVQDAPSFLQADPTGSKMIVACQGKKNADTSSNTVSSIVFIDIDKKLILDETLLNTGKVDAIQARINSIAITNSEWVFIAMTNGLFRLDTREHKALSTMSSESYVGLSYNARKRDLLMISDTYIYIADDNSAEIKSSPLQFANPILFAIGQ
jgi:YVTN family beta-propeller protein